MDMDKGTYRTLMTATLEEAGKMVDVMSACNRSKDYNIRNGMVVGPCITWDMMSARELDAAHSHLCGANGEDKKSD